MGPEIPMNCYEYATFSPRPLGFKDRYSSEKSPSLSGLNKEWIVSSMQPPLLSGWAAGLAQMPRYVEVLSLTCLLYRGQGVGMILDYALPLGKRRTRILSVKDMQLSKQGVERRGGKLLPWSQHCARLPGDL